MRWRWRGGRSRTWPEPRRASIVFTSGATESDNLALKGTVGAAGGRGHVVTVASEHLAVLDSAVSLERRGCAVTVLNPGHDGLVDLGRLRDAIRADTILVSVMYANNEIGVIQPVAEIGAICREKQVLFHSDAVQAFGKIPVNVERDAIDLMSITAHKMYGPKGVGALVVGTRVRLEAQMDGGGHENGMRSGTLNVPGIVGLRGGMRPGRRSDVPGALAGRRLARPPAGAAGKRIGRRAR